MTAAVNIAVAFPGLLLALFFAVIFGVGATGAVLAIGLAGAPTFARLTQTLVASVAARDFVAAARIAGVGRLRVLFRHVLPNIAEPLVVNATIGAGGALLAFAGLSFLGLGVQPPALRLGSAALRRDRSTSTSTPRRRSLPGVAVIIAGLAFNLFGESVAKGLGVGTIERLPALPSVAATARPHRPRRAVAEPPPHASADVVLDVRDLEVTFPGPDGPIRPVRGVTFSVRRGEAVGIVGESGSGKSLTALAVSRLVGDPGRVDATRLELLGTDLRAARHEGAAAPARHVAGDGVPGPDDVVQPDPADGRPARRGRAPPPGHGPPAGAGPRGGPAARRADRRPRAARAPVPARVLRRHAPARDDRHGPDGHARR